MKTFEEWRDELLREGQTILAKKQAETEAQEDKARKERERSWAALCDRLLADLGELARPHVSPVPPAEFGGQQNAWQIRLRPWGGAWVECWYRRAHYDQGHQHWTWQPEFFRDPYRQAWALYRVPNSYHAEHDPDLNRYAVEPAWDENDATFTESLSEAVALCHATGDSYQAALDATYENMLTPEQMAAIDAALAEPDDPDGGSVPPAEKPQLRQLLRYDAETPEGKYLVKRRDGTVVEWPAFVLGARDPHAEAALRAYADSIATDPDCHPDLPGSIRRLADEFVRYRAAHGPGDPTRGRHRTDDPATIAEMRQGLSA